MEMWVATYLAQVLTEERRREQGREPIVLFDINFKWLRPLLKSLIGLFL
ncbi:MAG TPA: hypothetical protein PLH19_02040 [Anaerolineae bacterium]|nr:hypothetical protein [Anaerolineae bacterium]HQH37303.1 hypothetical protein [Anaerolineae bacterium]